MNASASQPSIRPAAASANFRSVIAALAVAGALLMALQFIASRRQLIEDVRAQAHVVGLNSAAALLFDDGEAGSETLRALRPLPDLQAAALFTTEGRRLSEYLREGASPIRALPEREYQGDFEGFVLADPVMLDGRIVGHVAMRSGFGRLYRNLLVFAGLFVLAGAGALAVSYPVVRRMRREVRRAEAQLDRLAHFDPVTGQLNRCSCSTWTTSRSSTTRWATILATTCSNRWRNGCSTRSGAAMRSSASAATSSRSPCIRSRPRWR
jgi:hypothetical protein